MDNIQALVTGLRNKNDKCAYQCLKQLESESANSDIVYPYFHVFTEMLDDLNSYIRTRGILLIAANAKWDKDYKIDEIIDDYLKHVMDDKPITARQCIKSLPIIVKYKPDLKDCVCNALRNANPQIYKSSMQSLVCKDIQDALKNIEML
ncbi:MAG: SufBD protein [Ruminococcaceae bacterium]|nr:SufBD protein [Oscillospiraceae bacterium]